MVLTGEKDYRTPMVESEQFYAGLKLMKVETMLARIPNANHGIASKPSNLIAKVNAILAWFENTRNESTLTGSSKGIGNKIAKDLLAEGHELALHYNKKMNLL